MKQFLKKYRHAVPLILYAILYLSWFSHLEQNVTSRFHVIHMAIDNYIPFCEFFIVPYILWFIYVAATVLYFFFTDKDDYYRACTFLFTGMTIFLIVSTIYPNGHHLRPAQLPRDNIFAQMVAALYRIDTPTNLFPSIHVYNSLSAHFAVMNSKRLADKKVIRIGSGILCLSIIMSTMFLKQHSFFDVLTAFLLAALMYLLVYRRDIVLSVKRQLQPSKKKNQPRTNI
ncbi:MAG: phosphatase PAP2 family protein [Clostridiales bacterium]|nr:phosphatase PAP2 family protein [Clostridiales bacterium]